MRFIGVRHGQSEYNLKGLCNDDDSKQVSLTDLGVEQARKAAALLSDVSVSQIFTSPLLRARHMAEIISQSVNVTVTVEPSLVDIRSGFDSQPVDAYLQAIADDPLNTRVNGGESILDQFFRVSGFLDELLQSGQDNLLLVAHEETLRVFKAWSEGLKPEAVIGKHFENARPYFFERQ